MTWTASKASVNVRFTPFRAARAAGRCRWDPAPPGSGSGRSPSRPWAFPRRRPRRCSTSPPARRSMGRPGPSLPSCCAWPARTRRPTKRRRARRASAPLGPPPRITGRPPISMRRKRRCAPAWPRSPIRPSSSRRCANSFAAHETDVTAMRLLGRLEWRRGDLEIARALFERALDLAPDYEGARADLARLLVALREDGRALGETTPPARRGAGERRLPQPARRCAARRRRSRAGALPIIERLIAEEPDDVAFRVRPRPGAAFRRPPRGERAGVPRLPRASAGHGHRPIGAWPNCAAAFSTKRTSPPCAAAWPTRRPATRTAAC